MLPATTIRKMMRECFEDKESKSKDIISVAPGGRLDYLKSLKSRFNLLTRVECRAWAEDKADDAYMSLYINGVAKGRNPDDYFQLHFKEHNGIDGLWIFDAKRRRHGTNPLPWMPIVDLAQIETFLEQIIARQEKELLRDQRKQKVASLQQTGLTSRLKELGQLHNFSFAMSESTREVRLSIRIRGRKRGFHFAFPKGKLKEVIEQVPDLIDTLESLQKLGVHFKNENSRWIARQGKWIEPKVVKVKVKPPKGIKRAKTNKVLESGSKGPKEIKTRIVTSKPKTDLDNSTSISSNQ